MITIQVEIGEQLNKEQAAKLCKWLGNKLQKMGLSGEVRTLHKGLGNSFGVHLEDDDVLDLGLGSPAPNAQAPMVQQESPQYTPVTNPEGLGRKTTLQPKDPATCVNKSPTLLSSSATSFVNPYSKHMNLDENQEVMPVG